MIKGEGVRMENKQKKEGPFCSGCGELKDLCICEILNDDTIDQPEEDEPIDEEQN